jgi:hypothetical protein
VGDVMTLDEARKLKFGPPVGDMVHLCIDRRVAEGGPYYLLDMRIRTGVPDLYIIQREAFVPAAFEGMASAEWTEAVLHCLGSCFRSMLARSLVGADLPEVDRLIIEAER